MTKTFYQRHKKLFDLTDGLFLGNTVLERGLVLAPVVVASYNYESSHVLGLAFMAITFVTVLIASFIPKSIPYSLRAIIYTMIACLVFVPTAYLLNLAYPSSVMKVGVFLPLLVANSLIVVKSESRFLKKKKPHMIIDLLCHVLGFYIVIITVGAIREIFASGSLMGNPIGVKFTIPALLLPFSGFIIVGFLAAFVKRINNALKNPKPRFNEEE